MVRVYQYRLANTVCCAAEADAVVKAFGDRATFEAYFGGGMTFGLPSSPDYLGVWGARNSSRFRRVLRQSSVIELADGPPPALESTSVVHSRRPSRHERSQLETSMPARRPD
jgi:hypothetical protein